jgi:hypothetical protein
MKWSFWLLFSLCIVFFITTLFLLLLIIYVVKRKPQDYNDYTLSNQAEACSQNGTPCLCKIGSSSQKICFDVDSSGNTMTLQIPFLKWSQQLPPLDTLSKDETQPFIMSVKNKKLGAFRHPCFSDTVVCLRNMDDIKNPQRLCFQVTSKNAFLSGPTHYDMLSLS